MGKPSDLAPAKDNGDSLPTTPLVEGASSISMHRPNHQQNDNYNTLAAPHRQQYFDDENDDDDDDLPPLYSNHDPAIAPEDPLLPLPALEIAPHRRSAKDGITYYIDNRLDTDPMFLYDQLVILAQYPPRPICRIRGTHTETIRKGDKDENQTVVDFDLEIDLTSLLYAHTPTAAQQQSQPQKKITTVGNFEKVHRGTVFATRAPGFGGSSGGANAETGTPSLTEWCHRYCASAAGLKRFTLERRVTGYDFDLLAGKLTSLIRATNYLGHVSVTFPVHDARVEIYNDCAVSRWRLTRWVQIVAYVTLVFLLTWPWLAFRTKRWETAYVAWPLREDEGRGRYTSMSEEVWYNMWARAIQQAAVARRQGTLDQGDMQRANLLAGNPPPLPDNVDGGWAGAIQAGVEAMARVNRSFGWGADTRPGRTSRLSRLPNLGRRS